MNAERQWPHGHSEGRLLRYGYRLADGEIQKDPTEQEILGLLARETKAGHNSVQIADLLNDLGYRTRTGAEWSGMAVRHLRMREGRRAMRETKKRQAPL